MLNPPKLYDLSHLKFLTNQLDSYHSMIINSTKNNQMQEESHTDAHNLITIVMELNIIQQLNYQLKRSAEIATFRLGNLELALKVSCEEGVYCFKEMGYYFSLQVEATKKIIQTRIQFFSTHYQPKSTNIGLKIIIHSLNKELSQQLGALNSIIIEIGTHDPLKLINNVIDKLQIISSQQPENSLPLQPPRTVRFGYNNTQHSRPLGIFKDPLQIWQSFNLVQNNFEGLELIINNLNPYYSPLISNSSSKLYICHDMMNGYREDLNYQNNHQQLAKTSNHCYRQLHLDQTEIFNYFSHHTVTVPPKHWRMRCKRAGVKCLGTFIVENNQLSEQVYMSQQYALMLVYIARRCQFDGYLINIQSQVKDVKRLLQWLHFLTKTLHSNIPNSKIIWYDSLISTGKVASKLIKFSKLSFL